MYEKFKGELMSVRGATNQLCNDQIDIQTICNEVLKEMDFYIHVIPDFFSYNNEAVKIKSIYKKLKELTYIRNRVITCIDVERSGYLYNEYFDGMVSFINKFMNEVSCGGDNLSLMEKQLQTAIDGDPLFIDSLFGGKNNGTTDMELTDAIKNVEYLVDFLEMLKRMKAVILDTCNRASDIYTNKKYEPVVNLVKLLANSTCVFSNRVLDNIMYTYTAINNKLDDRAQVQEKSSSFKVF